jgi:hypothetical protein
MHHWSLKSKLLGTIAAVLLLTLITSSLAILASSRQRASAYIAFDCLSDAIEARDVIARALATYQSQADTIINLKADGADFDRCLSALSTAIKRFAEVGETAEVRAWADEMQKSTASLSANYQQEILPRVRKYIAATDPAEKTRLLDELRVADSKTDAILQSITGTADKGGQSLMAQSGRAKEAYLADAKSGQAMQLALLCGAIVLGSALGYRVASQIAKALSTIATDLSAGAAQTASAASQVSSSSQSLAEGSSQQAASLEETSSSLEEMSSMTKRNSDSADQANLLAKQARTAADTGAADMQAMNTAMAEIKTSSDDIAKIIKTIDEIAFQTNILALNAAVEAARAGEAGAGFAVVAEEVRNLAQRSAVAARDSAGKIEASIARTANGVQITEKVAHSLHEIVDKVRKADDLITEIANASKEQSQGITQVNNAISQMDTVTQSNAANAEESASAAEELNAQAAVMNDIVRGLVALTNGGAHTQQARTNPERPAATNRGHPKAAARSSLTKSSASSMLSSRH